MEISKILSKIRMRILFALQGQEDFPFFQKLRVQLVFPKFLEIVCLEEQIKPLQKLI